jgi:mitochondrial ribonuclease P protein 1
MLRQEGRKAPDLQNLRQDEWDHIVDLPSKSARRKYYQYLWQNEMKRESENMKKEQKRVENAERLAKVREENAQNDHIVYGLNYNTMFLRIYDATIAHYNNLKLIRSMMFDQKLIIDCSYDEHMNPKEAANAGKQLMLCFAENRMHDEPFDLTLCNVNPNSISSKTLKKFIPTMMEEDFPMNIHTESMVEKFDKKKLVYLTPHCNKELVEYSHDDIYIIGAMVDKTNNEPLSLAKAKKQGLRMAKLPLDKYLNWGAGSGKSLTLNQMVNIMLEMKKHGNWEKALRFVPRRKIIDDEEFFQNQKQFGKFKPNYNNRQNFQRKDSYRSTQRATIYEDEDDFRGSGKSRNSFDKEKKHFEKFKFNLDTWGKKVNKKSNQS